LGKRGRFAKVSKKEKTMNKLLDFTGNIAAVLGILICLVAGVTRLTGSYYVLGHDVITLFIGGIALMVMACLAKLQRLSAA
jgi:type IV secretory pathway VirB2 component (pilin)